jgi:hypothetical protein
MMHRLSHREKFHSQIFGGGSFSLHRLIQGELFSAGVAVGGVGSALFKKQVVRYELWQWRVRV